MLMDILSLSFENNIFVIGVEYPLAPQMKSIKINDTILLPKTIFNENGLRIISITNINNEKCFENQDHIN